MQEVAKTDQDWMFLAYKLAEKAAQRGEIPVGAVVVANGKLVATGFNRKEELQSPLGHAELIALSKAAKHLGRWRLSDCSLFVTLEPCPMCAGALVQARIERLVYATPDPKSGAVHSLYQIPEDARLNHLIKVSTGLMATQCSEQLKSFFKELRQKKKNS